VDPTLENVLKEKNLYSQSLIEKIAENAGTLQNLKEIPNDLKRVFVTTHDIAYEWHVKVQAAFQRYADNSISKTINFVSSATVNDVEKAYLLAWKLGCKGITIYRDGSKSDQVLTTGARGKEKENETVDVVTVSNNGGSCPECGGVTFSEGGCTTCRDCGWSKCKI
jgi:ribonucleoside-diphosphate reductase alpha chain